jgi:hypothetical protein
MENYLPLFVPVYGAFLLTACCFGCFYSRLLNRVSSLETRYRQLEDETYRRNQTQVVVSQPAAASGQAPPVPLVGQAVRYQAYYPTPGMYPTRGAYHPPYQPPQPSAPPQDPVPVYQTAGAKHI